MIRRIPIPRAVRHWDVRGCLPTEQIFDSFYRIKCCAGGKLNLDTVGVVVTEARKWLALRLCRIALTQMREWEPIYILNHWRMVGCSRRMLFSGDARRSCFAFIAARVLLSDPAIRSRLLRLQNGELPRQMKSLMRDEFAMKTFNSFACLVLLALIICTSFDF